MKIAVALSNAQIIIPLFLALIPYSKPCWPFVTCFRPETVDWAVPVQAVPLTWENFMAIGLRLRIRTKTNYSVIHYTEHAYRAAANKCNLGMGLWLWKNSTLGSENQSGPLQGKIEVYQELHSMIRWFLWWFFPLQLYYKHENFLACSSQLSDGTRGPGKNNTEFYDRNEYTISGLHPYSQYK